MVSPEFQAQHRSLVVVDCACRFAGVDVTCGGSAAVDCDSLKAQFYSNTAAQNVS
jgi:hypothetical protein